MIGKVLKVLSNDLNGNVDDRHVAVYAAFTHLKYMNKYIIFSFDGDVKNKLYYGSVHLKQNSVVIFSVNDSVIPIINAFVNSLLSGNINPKEYEIIDISKCEKAELVSFNELEFDKLSSLDKLTIKRVVKQTEKPKKKKESYGILYFVLFVLIALGIGVTYLYFNPDSFEQELKQLNCSKEGFNDKIDMNYQTERIVKFDSKEAPTSISVTDIYQFTNRNVYNEFKEEKKENTYFKNGEYKYDDERLQLKIFSNESTIIDNYEEMKNYLIDEGYTCEEETYYG